MLTANELRKVAARSGARDIGNVEIDVILTHLLQLFMDKRVMDKRTEWLVCNAVAMAIAAP